MISPTLIPAPGGVLYLSIYRPKDANPFRGWIVHVPAFAEEMNKARAMVNLQARLLMERGFGVIVPDLYGTGDSSGEFGAADWQRWVMDITTVLDWVEGNGGGPVCLWGLRLGCMLAAEVATQRGEQVDQLLLWQPVTAGKQYINQFLRLRMAAALQEGQGESTKDLRALLDRGHTIEVAGYDLCPQLVSQLDDVTAVSLAPPADTGVIWLEVSNQENKPIAPASQKVIEAWRDAGVGIDAEVVRGEPFWTTQEIAFAEELVATSEHRLRAWSQAKNSGLSRFPGVPSDTAENSLVPILFDCHGDELVGLLHPGAPSASIAVLLVVGGPQYRVGSHRQFVHLARALADAGIPVLRFDYRGMGDSAGAFRGFEEIGEDIGSAVDALQASLPMIQQVVIWGLCDAASAAAFYAPGDPRVKGLVLLNPWVRSVEGEARAYLKHYYRRRFTSREFWAKIARGDVDIIGSWKSLWSNLRRATSNQAQPPEASATSTDTAPDPDKLSAAGGGLAERVYDGLARCHCRVLLVISGNDLTAAEFLDAVASRRNFTKLLNTKRFERRTLAEADHTFSRRAWRDQVSRWTIDWLKDL